MKSKHSQEKIWHLVTVTIAPTVEETVSAMLFDLGANGLITLEENESSLRLGAYFDQSTKAETLAREIEGECGRAGILPFLLSLELADIADQDWMQKWKEGFEPINIGERLMVAPSWKLPADAANRAVIQIDPGMAFGTGTHETTRLCLEALEARWTGGSLIDVGTGTGILAIAAALLSTQARIVAIDIDPLAVAVASENCAINNVEQRIEVRQGQPSDFAGLQFDMVVANLTAEVIIALMDDLTRCVKPAGLMILSGILTTLRGDVERAIEAAGLTISERKAAGEWSMLVARSEAT
ncbi:MAG: 50S ribosomal protein L11 methyltransferase [Acidobacteria bacterium]|nr:50S ribosomal protein L11 methyltransferase [Acidobacteriota bacterium]